MDELRSRLYQVHIRGSAMGMGIHGGELRLYANLLAFHDNLQGLWYVPGAEGSCDNAVLGWGEL